MDIHAAVNDIEFRSTFREWAGRVAPMMFDYRIELMRAGFPESSADYLVSNFMEYLVDIVGDDED